MHAASHPAAVLSAAQYSSVAFSMRAISSRGLCLGGYCYKALLEPAVLCCAVYCCSTGGERGVSGLQAGRLWPGNTQERALARDRGRLKVRAAAATQRADCQPQWTTTGTVRYASTSAGLFNTSGATASYAFCSSWHSTLYMLTQGVRPGCELVLVMCVLPAGTCPWSC